MVGEDVAHPVGTRHRLACHGRERPVAADHHARVDAVRVGLARRSQAVVEAHAGQDGGPARVADGQERARIQGFQQPVKGAGHAGQGEQPGRRLGREPMAGQIGRDHREAPCHQGGEPAPGMGRGTGPVDKKNAWAAPQQLDMPAQAGHGDEPAGLAVRPALPVPLPAQAARRLLLGPAPFPQRTAHAAGDAVASTARERAAASA
jgi:hypothetical protein